MIYLLAYLLGSFVSMCLILYTMYAMDKYYGIRSDPLTSDVIATVLGAVLSWAGVFFMLIFLIDKGFYIGSYRTHGWKDKR